MNDTRKIKPLRLRLVRRSKDERTSEGVEWWVFLGPVFLFGLRHDEQDLHYRLGWTLCRYDAPEDRPTKELEDDIFRTKHGALVGLAKELARLGIPVELPRRHLRKAGTR